LTGPGLPAEGQRMSLRNIVSRAPAALSGTLPTLISASGRRHAVEIHNLDSVLDIWVAAVNRGAAAPVLSSASRDFVIGPGQTLILAYSESIDIHLMNSSGSTAVSTAMIKEAAL
jgi:hypothetical protein